MSVKNRERTIARVVLWGLVIVLLFQGWLMAGLADRLRETRAELEDSRAALRQARLDFERCKGANAGLVEGLREQQALINEAIDLVRRCESRGALWAGVTHAR